MPVIHSIYRESGEVRIDPQRCKHCGSCAKICPTGVLTMADEEIQVRSNTHLGCIACGHCMMVCPDGGITVTGRDISLKDLEPLPAPETRVGADGLAALMQARRSVRRFTDQEVDSALLDRIIEMAATAPMSIPPWDVGVVTVRGREEVQQVAAEIVKGYEGFLKIFRPWVLGGMRLMVRRATYEQFKHFIRPLAQDYVESRRAGSDSLFWNAPAVMIFHHSPYAEPTDAAIACTYAMLAAQSLGLGSTIIGGAAPMLQRNKSLSRRLGVPDGNSPSISLILGYSAARFRRAVRRRFASVGAIG